jgi:ParB family transcriptional regulator, chromosome partitioning protein
VSVSRETPAPKGDGLLERPAVTPGGPKTETPTGGELLGHTAATPGGPKTETPTGSQPLGHTATPGAPKTPGSTPVNTDKGKRLGRGLEALLGRHETPTALPAVESPLREIPVAEIRPNPYQPRREFKPEEIEELKESLKQNGLLQPITVRSAGSGFELIAGERRLRAAIAAGWTQITAIVRTIDDRAALTLALVENLQRADLNPIEEAEGYQRLVAEFHLSHDAIAKAVGKHRTTIVNSLRLLGLPDQVRTFMREGKLSAGHGRAILGLDGEVDRNLAAHVAIAQGFSVRNVEEYVKKEAAKPKYTVQEIHVDPNAPKPTRKRNPEVVRCEDRLRTYLQTDVRVEKIGPISGNITIRFWGEDDLGRIVERMTGPENSDEAP